MTKTHAVLGASSAHRWIACPGSVRAQRGLPDRSSTYAKEGTAAHDLAERCLRAGYDAARFIGEDIVVEDEAFEVDEEMAEAVQVYLDYVRRQMMTNISSAELLIEHEFQLTKLYPGMWGTNDACVYLRDIGKLIVIDYKHGRGHAVEAAGNPQLRYYGYGAATDSDDRPIDEIELVIVQPRAPHKHGSIRSETINIIDLMDWSSDLVVAAKRTEDPEAPLVPGDHCTFCKAAPTCVALRDSAIQSAGMEFGEVVIDLAPSVISDVLRKADMIEDWIHAVRAHALSLLEQGQTVPGFKLVEKRATRKWREFPEAILLEYVKIDDLYKKKPLSPAQVEKLLPKDKRKELTSDEFVHVSKESTGNTLAPESDGRKEKIVGRAENDFEAV